MTEDTPQLKVDEYVRQYVELRDCRQLIDEEYKEKRQEVTAVMEKIDGLLQAFFTKTGTTKLATKYGTAYIKTKYTASLADPEIFKDFVIEHKLYELTDIRANSTAVQEYVKEHNALPPGVNLKPFTSVGVNRA
jgi:hypothetical protein